MNDRKKSNEIHICTFDLFGEGRHQYTFENLCQENHEIALGDGTVKMFLNTEGTKGDISGGLKAFLDYVGGRESDSPLVRKLEAEVSRAKKNREWRREYMTLLMRDQENIEKGIEQGIKKGMEQGVKKGMEQGVKKGMEQGVKKGIEAMVSALKDFSVNDADIIQTLQEKFELSREEAKKYV